MTQTLTELRSEDWKRRREAVRQLVSLSHHSSAELAEGLIQLVQEHNQDLGALNASLQVLGTLGPLVVARLEPLLAHPLVEVRLAAGIVLSQCPPGLGEDLLLRMLADEDVNVRYHAVEGLGLKGCRRAVPALVELAQGDDFFLAFAAIEALGRLGDPTATPELCERLTDELCGEACAEALGALGHCLAVPSLVRQPTPAALQAVERLAARYCELGREAQVGESIARHLGVDTARDLLARREGLRLLAWWGPTRPEEEWKPILELLEKPAGQVYLAGFLRRLGEPGRARAADLLPHEDVELRLLACELLAEGHDERCLDPLCVLLNHPKTGVVTRAAVGLGRLGSTRALPALLACMGHPHPVVRDAVLAAGVEIQGSGRVALAYLEDADPMVRAAAVRWVRATDSELLEPQRLLAASAAEPDLRVRSELLQSMVLQLGRAPELLGPALESRLAEGSAAEKAALVRALCELEGQTAEPLLLAALADGELWTLIHACRTAAMLGCCQAIPALRRLLGDARPPVQAEAAKALGLLDPEGAAEALGPLLTEENPDVVLGAISGLGLAASPEAHRRLFQLTHADDPLVRHAALEALTGTGWATAAEPALLTALQRAEDVESVAVTLLANPHPESRRFLETHLSHLPLVAERLLSAPAAPALNLDDPDPWRRRQAILAAVEWSTRPARLTELAQDDPDPGVRLTARLALAFW